MLTGLVTGYYWTKRHYGVESEVQLSWPLSSNKVLDAARQGKAAVQVIPFEVGEYAAVDAYFVLLDFDEESNLSPVVFIEGLTGNQYIERKADIARYREAIESLRDSALSVRDSLSLMQELREAYVSA